jgi:hypothetical protein
MKRYLGFSLTELLIGLFLASFIMNALVQFYIANKRQYLKAESALSTQFDLFLVSDLLSNSIRRAGFTPCVGVDHLRVIDRRDLEKQIFGIAVENQSKSRILVNRMNESYVKVISIVGQSELMISNEISLNEHLPIMIADCEHAEIHNISSSKKIGRQVLITLTKPLIYSYEDSAYVGEWLEEQWFIKRNSKGDNSLFYKLLQTEELSAVIHSMKVKMKEVNHKKALEIFMDLKEGATQELMVVVRAS